jgi:hypothetical protein
MGIRVNSIIDARYVTFYKFSLRSKAEFYNKDKN